MILETVFYCIDHDEPQQMAWDETTQDHKCPKCGKVTTLEPGSMITLESQSEINGNGMYAVEVRMRVAAQ